MKYEEVSGNGPTTMVSTIAQGARAYHGWRDPNGIRRMREAECCCLVIETQISKIKRDFPGIFHVTASETL